MTMCVFYKGTYHLSINWHDLYAIDLADGIYFSEAAALVLINCMTGLSYEECIYVSHWYFILPPRS